VGQQRLEFSSKANGQASTGKRTNLAECQKRKEGIKKKKKKKKKSKTPLQKEQSPRAPKALLTEL